MSIAKFIRDIERFFKYSTDAEPTTQQQFQEAMKNWINTETNLVDVTLWQPTTAYKVGDIVKTPSLGAKYILECTANGISGAEEPNYSGVGVNTVVTDGTAEWIVRLQGTTGNCLPLSGGTMTGNLVTKKGNPIHYFDNTNATRGTAPSSAVKYTALLGRDKNNVNTWGIYSRYEIDRSNRVDLIAYKGTTTDSTWSGIGVGYDSSGNAFTYAPTPAQTDDSTKIATTAYVKDCVPKSIGSTTKPVYTNANGVITASNATVGSATQPMFLDEGTMKKCTYTLGKSVPSNAVFTDTNNISAHSIAAKGYIKFNDGLIIQWGYQATSATSVSITFPISFASACYAVGIAQYWQSGVTGGVSYVSTLNAAPTKTTLKLATDKDKEGVYWIAIGK